MSGVGVAVECALRRGRTRKRRLLAMIAAIAVGIAGLVLVAVVTTIAGDRAMQRVIGELDPEARAFTVTFSPDLVPSAADLDRLNSKIHGRLQRQGLGPTIRTVEFRALAAGDGRTVRFAGLDDLDSVARLVDGVWPTRCDADRCEVVALIRDLRSPAPDRADSLPVRPSGSPSWAQRSPPATWC